MKSEFPTTVWGHAILHATSLVRLRPSHYNKYSPSQLVFGHEPNIAHLGIFGCVVYVPVAPPQRTKMGPQRRLGIYVGFDSPSIFATLSHWREIYSLQDLQIVDLMKQIFRN